MISFNKCIYWNLWIDDGFHKSWSWRYLLIHDVDFQNRTNEPKMKKIEFEILICWFLYGFYVVNFICDVTILLCTVVLVLLFLCCHFVVLWRIIMKEIAIFDKLAVICVIFVYFTHVFCELCHFPNYFEKFVSFILF